MSASSQPVLLYGIPFSQPVRAVMWLLLHKRVPFTLVPINPGSKSDHGSRSPAYLEKNPGGTIPTLEEPDTGFVLGESNAIMAYLADKSGPTPLYPTELQPRADVNRWLFWSAHHFTPAVSVLNWERLVKGLIGGQPADPKEEERGERLVTECARLLDDHLAKNEWLAQGRLTLADIAVATPLMSTVPARLPIDDRRHLRAWFGRIQELESWKKTNPAR